jgi:nitrate reductase gamma subunit/ferredoxin
MSKIDPGFAAELKKYGAKDFNACFNCGNCTAICGLTEKDASFPRIFIRDGLLGQKEDILESRELWLCYACGDCSESCPRQAGPGEYMAALRRYAIASYEPTGLTGLIFRNNPLFILFVTVLSVILGLFLFTLKPEQEVSRWLFDIIPYEAIHNMGLVIFGIAGISVSWGVITMWLRLSRKIVPSDKPKTGAMEAIRMVASEMATMKRYATCDTEEGSYWIEKPRVLRPAFVHWAVMWGFLGLLLATVLDFILKDPSTATWWPSRVLGTIAGIFLVYGTTVLLSYRFREVTKSYAETRLADWLFLWSLWIAGITGFWLETSVSLGADHLINHLVLLVHTIISMELVLLFSFSKFAHAVYRPLALFFYFKESPLKN